MVTLGVYVSYRNPLILRNQILECCYKITISSHDLHFVFLALPFSLLKGSEGYVFFFFFRSSPFLIHLWEERCPKDKGKRKKQLQSE